MREETSRGERRGERMERKRRGIHKVSEGARDEVMEDRTDECSMT